MAAMPEVHIQWGCGESVERRGTGRRELCLHGSIYAGAESADVIIHNLSSTGLLIETTLMLTCYDGIQVHIPEVGLALADIVWSSERLFGCQFKQSLSRAAVSAARLRSAVVSISRVKSVPEGLLGRNEKQRQEPRPLSRRAKVVAIAFLGSGCWLPIILGAFLLT